MSAQDEMVSLPGAAGAAAAAGPVGIVFVALGVLAFLFPAVTANVLDRQPNTVSDAINLRATWGGTLMGIGAALWTGRFTPTTIMDSAAALAAGRWGQTAVLVASGTLWIMLAIAAARGVAFAIEGSPNTRQWVYFVGELAIAAGAALYLRDK